MNIVVNIFCAMISASVVNVTIDKYIILF